MNAVTVIFAWLHIQEPFGVEQHPRLSLPWPAILGLGASTHHRAGLAPLCQTERLFRLPAKVLSMQRLFFHMTCVTAIWNCGAVCERLNNLLRAPQFGLSPWEFVR